MKTGKLLALMLPLVLVMVLAVACGSDEPAPAPTAAPAQPGLTAAELQAELQSAIAGIQIPEGLSADDLSKIVSDQLAAQPGITAADLQKAVDAAVVLAVAARKRSPWNSPKSPLRCTQWLRYVISLTAAP